MLRLVVGLVTVMPRLLPSLPENYELMGFRLSLGIGYGLRNFLAKRTSQ